MRCTWLEKPSAPGDRDQAACAKGLLAYLQDDAHLPPFVLGPAHGLIAAILLHQPLHRRRNPGVIEGIDLTGLKFSGWWSLQGERRDDVTTGV